MKLKNALVAGILVLGLGSSGCLGPDNLYGQVKHWNRGISEQDWVVELLFIGMSIIPVYPLALTGDVLIFNTIEYWSGNNPISSPGQFESFSRK
jgi:hypothetical protein